MGVSGRGSGPLPTTQAPETTAAPETTQAPETTTQRPRPTLPTTQAPETTEAPATTAAPETTAPHDNCKPITSTEAPVTTEAPATTEAPETTQAPEQTTGAPEPESGVCRRYVDTIYATEDAWCATNCTYGGSANSGCCFESSEDQCKPREHHCFCPGNRLLLV